MGIKAARGQSDGNQLVLFKILDSTGTPTIVNVSPPQMAADISITDTNTGTYDVVIKNFQGAQQAVNIQATSYVISTFASVTARSYSGADLSLTIVVNSDAGSDTDTAVDVRAEAF